MPAKIARKTADARRAPAMFSLLHKFSERDPIADIHHTKGLSEILIFLKKNVFRTKMGKVSADCLPIGDFGGFSGVKWRFLD